jgi:hypothetical protein
MIINLYRHFKSRIHRITDYKSIQKAEEVKPIADIIEELNVNNLTFSKWTKKQIGIDGAKLNILKSWKTFK